MRRGRPLAAVLLVVTGGGLPAFLTGAVSVQLRAELDFGAAALGVAVAAFFAVGVATSAVLGRLTERIGPARAMQTSAALSTAVLVLVAAVARSYPALVAVLALGGMGNALAQPAANLFLARTIDPGRLGLALAIKQCGLPLAALLGGLAVPALALTVGWRAAFLAAGLVPLAGGLAVPRRLGGRPAVTEVRAVAAPTGGPSTTVLAVTAGLAAAAAGTLGPFLVASAVDAGMAEGRAGVLVAAGSALGIAVRLLMGARADRRPGADLGTVAVLLALGSIGFGLYASGVVPLLVLATPLAFGAGWGWPGLLHLAVVRANPDAPGRASGVMQTGTYVGVVSGPIVFGALVETWGYDAAWLAAAALALAGASLIARTRTPVLRAA